MRRKLWLWWYFREGQDKVRAMLLAITLVVSVPSLICFSVAPTIGCIGGVLGAICGLGLLALEE